MWKNARPRIHPTRVVARSPWCLCLRVVLFASFPSSRIWYAPPRGFVSKFSFHAWLWVVPPCMGFVWSHRMVEDFNTDPLPKGEWFRVRPSFPPSVGPALHPSPTRTKEKGRRRSSTGMGTRGKARYVTLRIKRIASCGCSIRRRRTSTTRRGRNMSQGNAQAVQSAAIAYERTICHSSQVRGRWRRTESQGHAGPWTMDARTNPQKDDKELTYLRNASNGRVSANACTEPSPTVRFSSFATRTSATSSNTSRTSP